MGCRHSEADYSVPTILPPRVRVPSTPSTHLRTKINKKRPGVAHQKRCFGDAPPPDWKDLSCWPLVHFEFQRLPASCPSTNSSKICKSPAAACEFACTCNKNKKITLGIVWTRCCVCGKQVRLGRKTHQVRKKPIYWGSLKLSILNMGKFRRRFHKQIVA